MIFTEAELKSFAAPLSASEESMCRHAISEVRDALLKKGFKQSGALESQYPELAAYEVRMSNADGTVDVKLLLQGSYANNTNIKGESDVDIAVIREDRFSPEYRTSGNYIQSSSDYGFISAPTESLSFKDQVQLILESAFEGQVERHNKSIKVKGNTYRKNADTVPSMRSRDYRADYTGDENNYIGGIEIRADDGSVVINYPEQHIAEGRAKNVRTHHAYKKQVRIMKTMRDKMSDVGLSSADKMSSFGLESLVWNLPDEIFTRYPPLGLTFDDVIIYLKNHSIDDFKEANGIKSLFNDQAEKQTYLDFISDLRSFFSLDLGSYHE